MNFLDKLSHGDHSDFHTSGNQYIPKSPQPYVSVIPLSNSYSESSYAVMFPDDLGVVYTKSPHAWEVSAYICENVLYHPISHTAISPFL